MMRLATLSPGLPEIFLAPQGEGPSAGESCVFVRLSQCNLHCIWCDTPYTWNFTGTDFQHRDDRLDAPAKFDRAIETIDVDLDELVADLTSRPCRRLVLTGGEPLLQQRALGALCTRLKTVDLRWVIEIETNGTLAPKGDVLAWVDQFNVSPKLHHSGNPLALRRKDSILADYARDPRAVFKFVVQCSRDLDEINDIVGAVQMPAQRVWLMPEGTDSKTLCARMGWIREACAAYGYQASDRLQIHAHGDTRGT
ncbi:MAG: 7-carboxy-7-deazaguanine synthase QueE [Pseudomonadota bacterium]